MTRWTPAGIVACGVGLLLAACGGSGRDAGACHPVSPAAPSGCATISVTASTPLMKVGQSFRFAATARHDDGSVVAVSEWSSDNRSAAAIESASGIVSGGANGRTHIIPGHDGVRLSIELRVVPDYQAVWTGDYQVTACHESGQFMGFCQDFPIGAMFPVSLELTQPQATVDGTFTFGEVSASAHGSIDDAGHLRLDDAETRTADASVRLVAAMLDLTARDELQGAFRTVWRREGAAGEAGYNGQLRFVNRSSAMPDTHSPRRASARSSPDVSVSAARRGR